LDLTAFCEEEDENNGLIDGDLDDLDIDEVDPKNEDSNDIEN